MIPLSCLERTDILSDYLLALFTSKCAVHNGVIPNLIVPPVQMSVDLMVDCEHLSLVLFQAFQNVGEWISTSGIADYTLIISHIILERCRICR